MIRGTARTAFVLLGLTGALVVAGPPASAAPNCLGRRATIYEPDVRWLRGTGGDDVIVGTAANWTLDGLGGDDVICQADADQVEDVDGGRGDDRIVGTHHLTGVVGGPGDDVLSARVPAGLSGGPGDDVLRGGGGQSGGPGDDVMVELRDSSWVTYFGPGPGRDLVDSRRGIGSVSFGGAPRGVRVRLANDSARGWGRDRLIDVESVAGTAHDDVLIGTDEVHLDAVGNDDSNRIDGFGGNDTIAGRGGPDWLEAGEGVDVVRGGAGDDVLRTSGLDPFGLPGDRLLGGPGDDGLTGGRGSDVLDGGAGDDRLHGLGGHNSQSGGPGDDRLHFGGHVENLVGGEGVDTVAFTVFGPVRADLREQKAYLGRFVVELDGIESLWGSFYGDTLIGDDGANFLFDGGNYSADGQQDVLAGAGGDDVVAVRADPFGSATGDTFVAEGGDGADALTFFAATDPVVADLAAETAAAGDSPGAISGFENLIGGPDDDSLAGDGAANLVAGLGGDDALSGRGGDDALSGDEGEDAADGGDGTDACDAEQEVSCERDAGRLSVLSRLLRILRALDLR